MGVLLVPSLAAGARACSARGVSSSPLILAGIGFEGENGGFKSPATASVGTPLVPTEEMFPQAAASHPFFFSSAAWDVLLVSYRLSGVAV